MSNKFDAENLKKAFTETLVEKGIPEAEAARMAANEINSIGAIKTANGTCPKGGTNPMACMFCECGHMTDCHFPLTCAQAQCSHYHESQLEEIELPPEEAALFTNEQ